MGFLTSKFKVTAQANKDFTAKTPRTPSFYAVSPRRARFSASPDLCLFLQFVSPKGKTRSFKQPVIFFASFASLR